MATIQGVYVALFGRPADPTGLAYFNSVTDNGADLSAIGDLASTSEYTTRFSGMTSVQIVNSIYQSLFNRDAEDAGLEFFVNALNEGTLTINNIAIAILDGAQGSDATTVANKIAAAELYTAALDTAVEIASYSGTEAAEAGRTFLESVTDTVPSTTDVDTAVASMASAGVTGNTVTLTTAASVVSTTSYTGADKVTTDNNDTIVEGTVGDWTSADTIDAGYGTDTLQITIASDQTVAADGLKSVEILSAKATTASVLNVANATDLTKVINNASTTNLSFTGIALGVEAVIQGSIAGTTANFTFADASGSSDAATLTLEGVTSTGAITVADIESLTVANSGTSSVAALTAADATAITYTGSGTLSVADATNTVTETIDASAFTGALTIDLSNDNALKSFTGSANADTVTIDTTGLTNDVTVTGGAGADTLTITGTAAAAKSVTLTGGDGSDIFEIGSLANAETTSDSAALEASLVVISDFDASADAIKVDGVSGAFESLLTAEQAAVSSASDLLAAATLAASYVAAEAVTTFNYGSDTYILINDSDAGFDAGDGLVKVTGLSDDASLTSANFEIV